LYGLPFIGEVKIMKKMDCLRHWQQALRALHVGLRIRYRLLLVRRLGVIGMFMRCV